MTTIKFDKAVKYKGVRYAAHEVFKVDDEDVDQLKVAGATVLSTDTDTPPASTHDEDKEPEGEQDQEQESAEEEETTGEDVDQLKEKLLDYTVPELVKFAEERNIDLQKKTKKAEIYNIIIASLE